MSSPEAKRIEKLLFRRLRGRTQPLAALRKSPSPAQRKALQAEKAAAKASGKAPLTKNALRAAARSTGKSAGKPAGKKAAATK